jgi:hypothetical protein
MPVEVRAIPEDVLGQLRVSDDAGRPPRLVTDRGGGGPLRCCLRLSRPGEWLALVAYAPLRRWARDSGADPGPYDEVGPVFIHPQPCGGLAQPGWPPELAGARRVLRAYSADGSIRAGLLADAAQLSDAQSANAVLEGMFADRDVAVVHARAVEYGCFTFEIRRGAATPSGSR